MRLGDDSIIQMNAQLTVLDTAALQCSSAPLQLVVVSLIFSTRRLHRRLHETRIKHAFLRLFYSRHVFLRFWRFNTTFLFKNVEKIGIYIHHNKWSK